MIIVHEVNVCTRMLIGEPSLRVLLFDTPPEKESLVNFVHGN